MNNKVTVFDYDFDWVLKDTSNERKTGGGTMTLGEAIAFTGSLGVDGIELSRRYWENTPTAQLKSLVNDSGLHAVSYIFYEDLVLQSLEQRGAAVQRSCRQIERTADLGASIAMIIPAVAKEGVAIGEQRSWLVEGLRKCAEYAQTVGVILALENIDDPPCRPLVSRAKDCLYLCETVDLPSFGLIFDPGCALFLDENEIEALKTVAPRLVHVHLKNARPIYPREKVKRYGESVSNKKLTGTVLDGGLANIPAVLSELNHLNYQGYLMIEYLGEIDPRHAIPYNINYLRTQM